MFSPEKYKKYATISINYTNACCFLLNFSLFICERPDYSSINDVSPGGGGKLEKYRTLTGYDAKKCSNLFIKWGKENFSN